MEGGLGQKHGNSAMSHSSFQSQTDRFDGHLQRWIAKEMIQTVHTQQTGISFFQGIKENTAKGIKIL